MNCTGTPSHAMADGAKHCAECGKPPAAEMVKCGACSTEMIKSAKFCVQCGEAQGDATKEFEGALSALNEFQKSLAARAAGLATLPTVAEAAADQKRVDEILKSAAAKDEKGEPAGYDALVLVPELLKDNAELRRTALTLGEMVKSYMGHLATSDQKHAEATAVLMTAHHAQGHFLKAFISRFEEWANASRGRVGDRVLKGFTMADRPAPGGAADPSDLRGEALMTKALAAKGANGEPLFMPHEIAVLNIINPQGLRTIQKNRPEMAARLEQIAA